MPDETLPILYQKMTELTGPSCKNGHAECSQFASRPARCCEKQYCDAAAAFAKEKYGVDLVPTGHPDIPFMGPTGCIVAPHMRPICSRHVCTISWAATSHLENDAAKTKLYFEIRKRIEELENATNSSSV